MKRSSGVLMHISSLPSPYGIGTFGNEARKFVDFLVKAGQSYWQILPLGPTSFGDSPYSSFSAFAGNPYFIDLDILCNDGLLKKSDYQNIDWKDSLKVNYSNLYKKRYKVLKIAYKNYKFDKDYFKFYKTNKYWLDNYSLFMSIKMHFNGCDWLNWPIDYRLKKESVISKFIIENEDEIMFYNFIQYEFYKQWNDLKQYANKKGIKLFGDCPIYVSLDSADVWGNREIFKLNKDGTPKSVAGVPPDYFSKNGQLWGNPLYDWIKLKKNKYSWWIARIKHYQNIYDVLRIDHFIGFVKYYAIKYGSKDGKVGKMNKGPGLDLINAINKNTKTLKIVAEDLGAVSNNVRKLLSESKYPGMRVMCFGYDGNKKNDNYVENYPVNNVAYLTSHDTSTCIQWYKSCDKNQKEYINKNCQFVESEDINWNLINKLLSSKSNIAIIQAQDLLGLGKEGRMNIPGTNKGNWSWRADASIFSSNTAKKLYKYTYKNRRI